jgi:Trk-type K+ transport system membrane component
MDVVFECFSAFSTVGLSLGITAELSTSGKVVMILLMFIGRVGMLTILIAFVRSKTTYNYRYPTENILIN